MIIFGLLAMFHCCKAYEMLMIMSVGTKSHKHFYSGIAESLAERGHQITFINPFLPSSNKSNIEEIKTSSNYFSEKFANTFDVTMPYLATQFLERMPKDCVNSMLEANVQEVLKRNFDLVLLPFTMSDCYFSYIHERKIPFVYIFPNSMFEHHFKMVGNIPFPSVYPNILLENVYPMTFTQRVINTLAMEATVVFTNYVVNPRIENECRERGVWPRNTPSLSEMQTKASLTIVNSVRTLENPPRPYTPAVIFAGGLQIEPAKLLPKDLEDWIQESGDAGFIFFSLGSHVRPSDMKEEHRQIIVNVFKSLKQRIIWKWDQSEMGGVSPNVKLGPWFPQLDILGHPKIRLFITHGGLLSIQESTYYGVPTIGMPVFGDQPNNVFRMTSEGWGLRIDWKDLTEDKFKNAILDALTNPSIREKVKIRSILMKDRPLTASEEVSFWVEYILRYDGAKHLESPFKDLYWFHVYNVDVWVTLIAILLSVFTASLCVVKICVLKIRNKLKQKVE